jgi:sporulation protein YlmC with PRC-barrel domain
MRLADLIGSTLIDADGVELGEIADVWLVQDGPPVGPFGAALRVDALVVGRFGLASRAGFDRPDVTGPAPIVWFARRRTAHRPIARWADVAAVEEGRVRIRRRVAELDRVRISDEPPAAGRRFSAGLELLDRQLVDPDGMMAGKVDDLELRWSDDGRPFVAAILAGPGALARRLGGRFGGWIASVYARLQGGSRDPARISFGVVSGIDDHVTLTVSREDVATFAFEAWVRDHVIDRIPGSG